MAHVEPAQGDRSLMGEPRHAAPRCAVLRRRLDAEKLEGRHYGEASCRQYRESLLHHALPHAWSGPQDTRLVEAHFAKHRTSRGAAKDKLATRDAKGASWGLAVPGERWARWQEI